MMDKVRRDVVRNELRQRHWRMALCVLFLPSGYSISSVGRLNIVTGHWSDDTIDPHDPLLEPIR